MEYDGVKYQYAPLFRIGEFTGVCVQILAELAYAPSKNVVLPELAKPAIRRFGYKLQQF
jgi:hypothetical protein